MRERHIVLRQIGKRVPLYVLLGLGAILVLVPFYWSLVSSFKNQSELFSVPNILVRHPTIANYAHLLSDTLFYRWFLNSLFIAIANVVLVLFLCSLGGYAFAKYRFRGRGALFLLILSSTMIPPWVTIIPIFGWFSRLHIVNTYLAVILPGCANAFGVFLMRQYIQGVPSSLIDAARVDGCSEFGIYWRVVVPIIGPALGALTILAFLGSWNSFLNPLILLRTPEMFTFPVGMSSLVGSMNPQYGLLMACAVVSVIPTSIIFFRMQRQLVAGITLGAVKE